MLIFTSYNNYLIYKDTMIESRRERTVFQAPGRQCSFRAQACCVLMGPHDLFNLHNLNVIHVNFAIVPMECTALFTVLELV